MRSLTDTSSTIWSTVGTFCHTWESRHFCSGRVRALSNVGLIRLFAVVVTATSAAVLANVLLSRKARTSKVVITNPELILPLWLLLEIAILVSNGSWPYHVPPFLPVLALGGTWLVTAAPRLGYLSGRGWPIIGRVASVIILFWLILWPTRAVAALQAPNGVPRQSSDWNQMVRTAIQSTPAGGKVYFLTWDAAFIMNVTHRLSVTRYEDIEPLVVRGYASDARWAEYLAEIEANPPKAMLISYFDPLPPKDLKTLWTRH